jgi:cell wall-associated NlpC family hydrolase
MQSNKQSIVVILLLVLSVTIITPAAPVSASALTDLLPQVTSASNSSSGNGLLNILMGLLLGKLFGNLSNTGSTDGSKVLGAIATTPVTANTDGGAIIATAQKYMGTPYVWGGETPDGWDCSGFTRYVMKQNGISLPRTAAEQFAVGTAVDKANLKSGDMIFFTTYKPGASHVGFYMGDGKFIHASSAAKQVTISQLDDPYYTAHYIGARRYTN